MAADLCVVGAGSGGFGAACAAARLGVSVILLEAADGVGDTSNWEPVAGGTGLCAELYECLRQLPEAICLQQRKCSYHPDRPWGWYDRDLQATDYRLSLSRRSGVPVTFEPQALDNVMRRLLTATGNCDLHLNTRFIKAEIVRGGQRVCAILAQTADGDDRRIEAPMFIDATADIHLACGIGCLHTIGPEGPEAYDEPSASSKEGLVLNNASPCYRVSPVSNGRH